MMLTFLKPENTTTPIKSEVRSTTAAKRLDFGGGYKDKRGVIAFFGIRDILNPTKQENIKISRECLHLKTD